MLVAHYRLHPNSSDLNTASIKHQYYDPEVYDEYIREEAREGGKQNNFVRMWLKTEVLYNPERDENGKAADGSQKVGFTPKSGIVELTAPEEKTTLEAKQTEKAETKKVEKASLPIREITVNEIVFEVFQNSAKTEYTAKQKDGGAITGKGKTLKDLNADLETNTI